MYQVIEYNDYRKENYIFLHGVTSDLEKAKVRAREIIEKKYKKSQQGDHQIYQMYEVECAEYVDLQPTDKKNVMYQYSYRKIDVSNVLCKTVRDVYNFIEEKVPKTISPDEIITKDVFFNLLHTDKKFIYYSEELDFSLDTFSTIVSIVKCEEF